MRSNLVSVISSWAFVAALAILLLNDLALKAAFPGALTGKLSDFAGMAMVGMLVLAPQRGRDAFWYCLLGVLFVWWKGPASDSLIAFVRGIGYNDFGRVIDYTDLFALAILPACSFVARQPERLQFAAGRPRQLIAVPIGALTIAALLGTSVMQTRQDYVIRDRSSPPTIEPEAVAAIVKEIADKHELKPLEGRAGNYEGAGLSLAYEFREPNAIEFAVRAYPNGLFFGKGGYEKADELRQVLKRKLGERFPNLEYVEALEHPNMNRRCEPAKATQSAPASTAQPSRC
jgi:hypothetical protein